MAVIAAGSLVLIASLAWAEPARLEFNRDIRPLLSDKCFQCHGPDEKARKSELRLDVRHHAPHTGKSGKVAVVPGQPEHSELVRRIFAADPDDLMPPPESNKQLNDAERELLRRWIAQGAEYQAHWAFLPPGNPELPEVERKDWVRNPIDRFILARLEQEGLAPSPEAERAVLIRRIALDLTGLPPTPAELEAFLNDESPGAYERLVERLMATRDYAERRAQDWLDLARYADTRGFADDKTRNIWPYRDWVVRALHRNMPFDRFTIEQLAGDMLPDATDEQRLATGFHRNAPQARGQTYPEEEYRLKGVTDRVNTTAKVWLGLTMECAECHDHKFDPISQRDYYSLFAIFNNVEHLGKGFSQGGPTMKYLYRPAGSGGDSEGERARLEQEQSGGATEVSEVPVMKELPEPRETFIHVRGSFLHRGDKVTPAAPSLFEVPDAVQPRDRLAFARWLVDGKNPLVARVVVNRFWQTYFGHGLVRTPDDFGAQGSAPTHPELLDWLACEFVSSGWDMKHLHRLIVTSSTYRQATHISPELRQRDPGDFLLARMPRLRLPAEQIRDQALAISGLLKPSVGGPSVFPPQPDGYWEERDLPGKWTASKDDELCRKSLYIYWRRMALHPTMELLDAPARAVCTVRRNTSNLPTQALVTLNDPIFVEAARQLARRIVREVPAGEAERLDFAFRLCLGRPPGADERSRFLAFLNERTDRYARDPAATRELAGEEDPTLAAWTSAATVLLNLDETITRP